MGKEHPIPQFYFVNKSLHLVDHVSETHYVATKHRKHSLFHTAEGRGWVKPT